MSLSRRAFIAGISALGVATGAVPKVSAAVTKDVLVDHVNRVLSFRTPISRHAFKKALVALQVPHRWVLADSVQLVGWTIDTPRLARGFGWTSLDSDGHVQESWAELVVDSFDNDREFDITVADQRYSTVHGTLHFRCERYPNVQIHDLTGRSGRRDHLQLLSKEGTAARSHRLVAVA